jgi:hypothetical protein
MKCELSVRPDELARLWLGDLDEQEATALEEHVFECTVCHDVLRRLAVIGDGVRVAMTFDRLPPLPTPEQLAELRASGMRLSFLDLAPGDVATQQMDLETDGIVYVLHAPLSAIAQVDLEICSPTGERFFFVPGVPFDAAKGEVVLTCGRHTAEVVPESLIRLISGDNSDTKNVLAEYRLVHHAVESL